MKEEQVPDDSSDTLSLDESNELYGYGVFNVHANCFVDLPEPMSGRPSTPDHVTKDDPEGLLDKVTHDHRLDSVSHLRIVEIRLANEADRKAAREVKGQ
ncbi:hypothetical protein [Halorarius halobius]|uniref:hypothetical protein n=1 Tax=Halorarius halobius TaxID=2962671 RepID=UPI0020CBBD31|nr:hypothetical protein [Halorarius halobius]